MLWLLANKITWKRNSCLIYYKVIYFLCCSIGGRLVISHPNGRKALEQEQQQFPDVVVSDLPDRMTLQKAAADHSFDLIEFIDEHSFYLAILKFHKDRS